MLNAAKTELMWFGSSSSLRSLSQSSRTIVVGTETLQPVESAAYTQPLNALRQCADNVAKMTQPCRLVRKSKKKLR